MFDFVWVIYTSKLDLACLSCMELSFCSCTRCMGSLRMYIYIYTYTHHIFIHEISALNQQTCDALVPSTYPPFVRFKWCPWETMGQNGKSSRWLGDSQKLKRNRGPNCHCMYHQESTRIEYQQHWLHIFYVVQHCTTLLLHNIEFNTYLFYRKYEMYIL